MALAGRCECGVTLELVAEDPDLHMRCVGLRWCGRCGDIARFRGPCPACNREHAREYQRRQVASRSLVYERRKAQQRRRYRTDAAWRKKQLSKNARRRTTPEAVRRYRKAWHERHRVGSGPVVACGCGCGATFRRYDFAGRERGYVRGHVHTGRREAARTSGLP